MLARFTQKRVLITGGASGLGEAFVNQFAQLGWKIAVVDINLETAQNVADKANQSGAEAIALYCDVGNDKDFKTIAKTIQEKWGGLDIIINNAGIAAAGMMEDLTSKKWNHMININLNSVFRGCHFWQSLLSKNGPAHIVNTASFAGIALEPSMMSYNVSKAAVIALSNTLRAELGGRNIGVSVVCPAFFKTNLVDSMTEDNPEVKEQILKWMARSKVSALDVAKDTINAIENNEFMVISHDYARKIYHFKRLFPKYTMKKMIERGAKIIAHRNKLTK